MLRLRGLCGSVPKRSHQPELKRLAATRKLVKKQELTKCPCIIPDAEQQWGTEHMGLLDRLFHRRPPEAAASLSRNDPCWCGSGKKYKKCHYEADQQYFSRSLKMACKGPV